MTALPPEQLLSRLDAALEDHLAWFAHWHRKALNLESASTAPAAARIESPSVFLHWLRQSASSMALDSAPVEDVAKRYEALHNKATATQASGEMAGPAYDDLTQEFSGLLRALRHLEKQLIQATAGLDPLTGVKSRFGFLQDIEREQKRFERGGPSFCLAVIEMNGMDEAQKAFGQEAADRILLQTTNLIRQQVRSFDDMYRLDSLEFVLVLKGAAMTEAAKAMERVRIAVQAQPVPMATGEVARITLAGGLASTQTGTSIEAILQAAQQALQAAKEAGGNQILAHMSE